MYCSKCGKENPDNSKFCSDCGTALTDEATRQTEESNVNNKEKTTSKHNYLKYCHNVKKINLLTLISQILSVLVVATIIFVPIYRCEFEADIEDIESVEQFEEALLNDGMISKDFSLYDDIIKIATVFFNTEESDSYNGIVVLNIALFALFQIIFSIILICSIIPKVLNTYNEFQNISNATMLKYNEMKLTGTRQSKQNFFKQQTIFAIVFYAIFDIIFTQIFGRLFAAANVPAIRYMEKFTGFSNWAILIVLLLVAFIFIRSITKREEQEMLVKITEEKYEDHN